MFPIRVSRYMFDPSIFENNADLKLSHKILLMVVLGHKFICFLYDAEFSNKANLTNHKENIHETEKGNLKKPENSLNQETDTKIYLENLEDRLPKPETKNADTKDTAPKCHVCDIEFANKTSLNKHEKTTRNGCPGNGGDSGPYK